MLPIARRSAPMVIGVAPTGASAWVVPVVPQSTAAARIKSGAMSALAPGRGRFSTTFSLHRIDGSWTLRGQSANNGHQLGALVQRPVGEGPLSFAAALGSRLLQREAARPCGGDRDYFRA